MLQKEIGQHALEGEPRTPFSKKEGAEGQAGRFLCIQQLSPHALVNLKGQLKRGAFCEELWPPGSGW